MTSRPLVALAVVLVALALAFASWGLVRLNTWYLASDQFAFLTLADDLRRGTVFHDDWGLSTIQPYPRDGWAYDALAQTYYWRDGKLFTRYPPGFPLLLAAAGALGGETAQHALNPILYLVTLVVLAGFTWTVLRDVSPPIAIGAAAAVPWLFLLLPTRVHLWGITVARDLPAHLFGLLALIAAARRAPVWSGLALGFACTIRPDAGLYLLSVAALLSQTRPPLRRLAAGVVAFGGSASPVLIYNYVVEGNPFRFTQGSEFRDVLGAIGPADGIVRVVGEVMPSGGAFQLSNLATTLPGNAIFLVSAFGWFTALVVAGALWGARRAPLLVAATVPYSVVAFLFYSCWSHPDSRYLAGVAACLMPLGAAGAVLACRAAATAGPIGRLVAWVVVAVPLARGMGLAPGVIPAPGRAGAALAWAALAVSLRGWIPSLAARPVRWIPLAPAIGFALLGVVLVSRSAGARDPFQAAQVERARAAVAAVMPAGSLVVTTTGLGRPAENLRHYSDLEAFYTEELSLLRVNGDKAMVQFALEGRRTFYLLDARDRTSLDRVREKVDVRVVERRDGPALLDWYVDPRRAPAGAVLYELVLPEALQAQIEQFLEAGDRVRRERKAAERADEPEG